MMEDGEKKCIIQNRVIDLARNPPKPKPNLTHSLMHDIIFIDCVIKPRCFYVYCNQIFRCEFINCRFCNKAFYGCSIRSCSFSNITLTDEPRECMYMCNFYDCQLDEELQNKFDTTNPCLYNGAITGWKKAYLFNDQYLHQYKAYVIIKLMIPEDANKVCGYSNKCRCDKAVVVEIQTMSGDVLGFDLKNRVCSMYDESFLYNVGDIVKPEYDFDPNPLNECSSGIHFFTKREDAVAYKY